jgi:predicted neuraminidase
MLAVAAGLCSAPILAAGALKSLEFIADKPPTDSSHASTIVETPEGILAAWFGGTEEAAPDVGIWLSSYADGQWSRPVEVARGDEEKNGNDYACFNPVLFQEPKGSLFLCYKVGPHPTSWWGRVKESKDNGHTWSASRRLPNKIIGPVRNKPVKLANGQWLCGASEENAGWRVHMESTWYPMDGWERTDDLNSAMDFSAIQPTILPWRDGRIQILARTRQGFIAESWSTDGGKTWPRLRRTTFPNPNSAIDGVVLKEGFALLACNPMKTGRGLMALAKSDDGHAWETVLELERGEGEYSYPAIIQSSDGLIHVVYTWRRQKIRHAVVDPWQLQPLGSAVGDKSSAKP